MPKIQLEISNKKKIMLKKQNGKRLIIKKQNGWMGKLYNGWKWLRKMTIAYWKRPKRRLETTWRNRCSVCIKESLRELLNAKSARDLITKWLDAISMAEERSRCWQLHVEDNAYSWSKIVGENDHDGKAMRFREMRSSWAFLNLDFAKWVDHFLDFLKYLDFDSFAAMGFFKLSVC